MLPQWRPHACAALAYVVLALAFAWPLPLHFSTHLTGSPEGDTGVYVWNLWVFQHEILAHHTSPYFTDRIFALTDRANLSLHNYTTFANLLALPLIGSFGVVTTFNVIYLFMTALSGYAMFLLARAMTPGADKEAWLAGAVFAWSPMLVTRGGGHFSLIAAAPLPLFMLLLMRAHRQRRLQDAVWVGLMLAVAFWSDVYYAVYCLILAVGYIGSQVLRVEHRTAGPGGRPAWWRAVNALILGAGCLVVALLLGHGWATTVFGQPIRVQGLYTPVLVLVTLVTVRTASRYRASIVPISRSDLLSTARLALCAGVAAAIPLLPVLYAVGIRIADGTWVSPPIYWRSSVSGVSLLAMVLPNPNHPLAPAAWRAWLSARPDGYLESVASIPLSAVLVLCLAWRSGWRAPRMWVAFWLAFTLLALGPFVHIAGINTYVPGPWALLRYVPIIGLARHPARFTVLIMLTLAVLFALALTYLRETRLARRPWLRWGIGALVILELLPSPRPLYSARVPAVYYRIAADTRDVRVLELPFGVRDGTFSVGNYTSRTQFFQTVHGKAVFGGVLSRVSDRRVKAVRSYPMLDVLIRLSDARERPASDAEMLAAGAPEFLARARIGYVVIDHQRASPALVDFAVRTLHLDVVASDGPFVLYRPVS